MSISYNLHFLLVLILFKSTATASLSRYEQIALTEFKELVNQYLCRDFMKSDIYLLRWLLANDFNVEVTVEKFHETLQWRKQHNIDNILFEDFSQFEENYPLTIDGLDKHGRPIMWLRLGGHDIRKLMLAGKEIDYIRYFIYMMEQLEIYMHRLHQNESNYGAICIADFAGATVKQLMCPKCAKVVPEAFATYQANYPELQYKAILINVPSILNMFVSLVKSFMTERDRQSTIHFGYEKDKWTQALLAIIPADQLPIEYGGTKASLAKKSHKIRNAVLLEVVEMEKDKLIKVRKDQGDDVHVQPNPTSPMTLASVSLIETVEHHLEANSSTNFETESYMNLPKPMSTGNLTEPKPPLIPRQNQKHHHHYMEGPTHTPAFINNVRQNSSSMQVESLTSMGSKLLDKFSILLLFLFI